MESATPLLDVLKQCGQQRHVAAFHFPGHSRGASAAKSICNIMGKSLFEYDLPELPGLDNLHSPLGAIAESQRLAAQLFGAQSTWFLVNGSTCGIQAAVMSTCKPGDYLILPRNCHISAVSAMVLSGALPHYVMPIYDTTWGISHGITLNSIKKAIQELKGKRARIGACLIVSPTYFGICSPAQEIAQLCHLHNIPLIVDEAHGAHFRFHTKFPATSLEQGADIVIQSTHKVLTSLTQSAMLHSSNNKLVSQERISRCLRALQSSSPSYLLMASLDAARAQMSTTGDHYLFDQALKLASECRKQLKHIPGISILDRHTIHFNGDVEGVLPMDELRITVGLWQLGITGTEADEILCEQHKVVAELPWLNSLTFALNTGTSVNDIKKLVSAMEYLSSNYYSKEAETSPWRNILSMGGKLAEQNEFDIVLSPRDAFYADVERVDVREGVGRVCAEVICPYPPGIPVVFPGEIITKEALNYLKQAREFNIEISGASDTSLLTILLCK